MTFKPQTTSSRLDPGFKPALKLSRWERGEKKGWFCYSNLQSTAIEVIITTYLLLCLHFYSSNPGSCFTVKPDVCEPPALRWDCVGMCVRFIHTPYVQQIFFFLDSDSRCISRQETWDRRLLIYYCVFVRFCLFRLFWYNSEFWLRKLFWRVSNTHTHAHRLGLPWTHVSVLSRQHDLIGLLCELT